MPCGNPNTATYTPLIRSKPLCLVETDIWKRAKALLNPNGMQAMKTFVRKLK